MAPFTLGHKQSRPLLCQATPYSTEPHTGYETWRSLKNTGCANHWLQSCPNIGAPPCEQLVPRDGALCLSFPFTSASTFEQAVEELHARLRELPNPRANKIKPKSVQQHLIHSGEFLVDTRLSTSIHSMAPNLKHHLLPEVPVQIHLVRALKASPTSPRGLDENQAPSMFPKAHQRRRAALQNSETTTTLSLFDHLSSGSAVPPIRTIFASRSARRTQISLESNIAQQINRKRGKS